jgi:ABC-type ATPase with predicted acetyltransferase domain
MIIEVDQSVPAYDSYVAERARGLYNVGVTDGQRFRLKADLPIEQQDWKIGVVVGPSGSGKSSILRELRKAGWVEPEFDWPEDQPIIEALDEEGSFAKATASLAAVGLGSVPSWLRPRHVLSMGEGFRADMAKLLLSPTKDVVLDEFTSVLDRQVAKVGAGAFAKAWRKQERSIILFTCHYDVLDWIEPDWFIDTAEGLDQFAEDRGVVVARKGDFQETYHRSRYPGDRVGTVEC